MNDRDGTINDNEMEDLFNNNLKKSQNKIIQMNEVESDVESRESAERQLQGDFKTIEETRKPEWNLEETTKNLSKSEAIQ